MSYIQELFLILQTKTMGREGNHKELSRIKRLYDKTLFYLASDPEVALTQARKSAEAICKSIYIKHELHKPGKSPEKLMLNDFIQILTRNKLLPKAILINLSTIQHFGNFAVHDQGAEDEIIDQEYVKPCLFALGTVFNWYMGNYYESSLTASNLSLEKETDTSITDKERSEKCVKDDYVKVVGNHAPPARIFEEDLATGFYFDIMRAIGRDMGLKFEFIQASNDMSFKMLKMGKADIMIGPNKTPEREKHYIFSSIPLSSAKKVFYVNTESDPILSYEDLFNKIVIIMKNTSYAGQLLNDERIMKAEVSKYSTGIDMVNNSTKYTIIMPEGQGDYLLEEKNIDLVKSPFSLQGELSYIIFHKKTEKKIIGRIEAGLQKIKQSGEYEDIRDMY